MKHIKDGVGRANHRRCLSLSCSCLHVLPHTRARRDRRYINHSCEPNLEIRPVRSASMVPVAALFARRAIEDGEELTFSYGKPPTSPAKKGGGQGSASDGDGDGDAPASDIHSAGAAPSLTPAKRRCHCGAVTCRGYLPFDPTI